MFVKVFYEDSGSQSKLESEGSEHHSSKLLVNPDCPIGIIYDYIQKSFEIRSELEFDLCDESGNLVFIYDKEPCSNGTHYLTAKGTYFIVLFERDEDNRLVNPTLSIPESFRKSNVQINDLIIKIKKQLNPGSIIRATKSSKIRSTTSALHK